jgi:hypothetical protein
MAFIGYKPDSKAYRFYNPHTRRVCVSQDVVFMEECLWDWSGDRHDEDVDGFGTFSVGLITVAGGHRHGHDGVMHDGVMPTPGTPMPSPGMQAHEEVVPPLSPVAPVSAGQEEPATPLRP